MPGVGNFSSGEKRAVLAVADCCDAIAKLGAFPRCKYFYSLMLLSWRKQIEAPGQIAPIPWQSMPAKGMGVARTAFDPAVRGSRG
ncbi:MAG: hypothetical protein ACP5P4_16085 [Steroidobacteraceae bacterium]